MITLSLATAFLSLPFVFILFRIYHDFTNAIKIDKVFIQIISSAAIFLIIGPPIGFLVFHLASSITELKNTFHFSKDYFFVVVYVTYLFGALPALLTGIVAGALKPWLKSWGHFFGIGLIGLMLSLLWSGAIQNPFGLSLRASISWIDASDIIVAISSFIASILSTRLLCGHENKFRTTTERSNG